LNADNDNAIPAPVPINQGTSLVLPNYVEETLAKAPRTSSFVEAGAGTGTGRRSVSVAGLSPEALAERRLRAQQEVNLAAHNQERAQKYEAGAEA
jgi:hypothetical protein